LIRMMSRNNPLWGAPRIHGELLKLGIAITEPTVSKYMVGRSKPPSQSWRTFLHGHVQSMVSVDFFTVPTVRFQVLYVFLVLAHDRRRILQFGVSGKVWGKRGSDVSPGERVRLRKYWPFCALCRHCAVNQSAEQRGLNLFGSPIGIRTYNPLVNNAQSPSQKRRR
jgi:hypothetical protein